MEELIRKSELVKNFSYKLEPLRKSGNKEEYNKRFNELLKKEEDKINGRKNNQTTTNEDV